MFASLFCCFVLSLFFLFFAFSIARSLSLSLWWIPCAVVFNVDLIRSDSIRCIANERWSSQSANYSNNSSRVTIVSCSKILPENINHTERVCSVCVCVCVAAMPAICAIIFCCILQRNSPGEGQRERERSIETGQNSPETPNESVCLTVWWFCLDSFKCRFIIIYLRLLCRVLMVLSEGDMQWESELIAQQQQQNTQKRLDWKPLQTKFRRRKKNKQQHKQIKRWRQWHSQTKKTTCRIQMQRTALQRHGCYLPLIGYIPCFNSRALRLLCLFSFNSFGVCARGLCDVWALLEQRLSNKAY